MADEANSMKKLLNVAFKDLTIAFRDPSALIWMLATPFLLTLVMAFAFGRLTGDTSSSAGLSSVPVVIVNHDTGTLAAESIVKTFQTGGDDLKFDVTTTMDDTAARTAVDDDKAAAAVIIPTDFSDSIAPSNGSSTDVSAFLAREKSTVEVYGNPNRPISTSIVNSVVKAVLQSIAAREATVMTSLVQLLNSGYVQPQDLSKLGSEIGQRAFNQASDESSIAVKTETIGAAAPATASGFDWLGYMAPSMAIMFLMFNVTAGGRSLLSEKQWGTLPRLLTTPSSPAHIIGGKIVGIFLTGLAQVFILILASALIFGVRWGSPLAVVMLVTAIVAAATGWGAALAAFAKSPGQAGSIGSMMAVAFGALAGNFVPRQNYPQWLQSAGLITPNAWGLEGFNKLAAGGGVADVTGPVVALLIMALVLFTISTLIFRRQYR
jgi:ABC-2 type transport system permease protein